MQLTYPMGGSETKKLTININTLSKHNFPTTSVQWKVPKTDQWQKFSNTFANCPPHKLLGEGQKLTNRKRYLQPQQ
jgi:hypothetical protein